MVSQSEKRKRAETGDRAAAAQSRRFIETARELGCDEGGDAFDRALDRILPAREPGEPAPRGKEQSPPKGSRRSVKRSDP